MRRVLAFDLRQRSVHQGNIVNLCPRSGWQGVGPGVFEVSVNDPHVLVWLCPIWSERSFHKFVTQKCALPVWFSASFPRRVKRNELCEDEIEAPNEANYHSYAVRTDVSCPAPTSVQKWMMKHNLDTGSCWSDSPVLMRVWLLVTL